MEGWRWLARMLRVQREATWMHLPEEAIAEMAWPAFRQAVIAVLEEQSALQQLKLEPKRSSTDTRAEPPSG